MEQIKQLAKQYNIPVELMEEMTVGVIERVEHAMKVKQCELTPELIVMAIHNWFECRTKFFEDYTNNTNGTRDKVRNMVLDMLTERLQ